jgi:lanthanide-dependent methanol dehydrogenase
MGRVRPDWLVVVMALLAVAACGDSRSATGGAGAGAPRGPARGPAPAAPVGDTRANPEPETGDWTRPAKDYASTRYSGLDEINTSNVSHLALAATFSTSVLRGHEAAPLVVNRTLYVVTPFPNVLYALDLTKPGWPTKWVYKPQPDPAAQGVACCDVVNRGAAYYNGALYYNTLDDHVVSVDASTGAQRWNVKVGEINTGETMTMAPLVARGKVIVGNSGGEMGVRGWLQALDAATGKVLWKAYATGPDKDVLIGARFKPFYKSDRGTDLGVSSWPAQQWKIGGGGAWGWVSFDPSLNLIYYGTANPGPWNPSQRPGDNKWTSTLFARDIDTGEAVWAYQYSPHDLHDYDGVNENVLLDLPVNGVRRKVLVHPDRNGYMYVIDRVTGEVLSARPFVTVNSVDSVNMRTGRPAMNMQKYPAVDVTVRDICPAPPGGKDWQPSAYSPRTGLLYVPHNNLCYDTQAMNVSYIEGTPYVGRDAKMFAGAGGNAGVFSAWDPVSAREVWSIPERFPVWSGALATAGDVVFYGTMDGWFKAVDARDGRLLWQSKTESGIIGQPTTFRGPDGKQYVAVLVGVGGWAGAVVAGNLDTRDSTAALGFANAMKELPKYTTKGGALYVFALK